METWSSSYLGVFKWKLLSSWKIHSLNEGNLQPAGPGQQLSCIFRVPCIPSCRSSGHPPVTSASHPCPAWLCKHLVPLLSKTAGTTSGGGICPSPLQHTRAAPLGKHAWLRAHPSQHQHKPDSAQELEPSWVRGAESEAGC